ncbi:MAG: NAD(P)-binding domain-containing protein [Rhodoferax sp.]|nr:NAD(P)-binding domain-containing protein [Rhodoferax sp.]
MPNSDIGLVGLAVMGQNLALNIADHGFAISVFNRTPARMHEFVAAQPGTPGRLTRSAPMDDFFGGMDAEDETPIRLDRIVKGGKFKFSYTYDFGDS